MNKPKVIVGLGWAVIAVGIWFFQTESDYASNSQECRLTRNQCLAEVLMWVGFAQVLAGIAIVLVGLHLKNGR